MSLSGCAQPYSLHFVGNRVEDSTRSKNGDFLSETEAGTFGRDFRHLKLQDEDTYHQIDWVAAASANDSSITDDECFDWEVGHVSQGTPKKRCLATELGGGDRDEDDTVLHLRCLALSRLPLDNALSLGSQKFLSVPHPTFVTHLSLLLMGVESSTFPLTSSGRLILCPRMTVSKVSPEVVSSMSGAFLEAGNAVRKIHSRASKEHHQGRGGCDSEVSAIYKGFVRGVNNWLMGYSATVAQVASTVSGAFEFVVAAQPLLAQAQYVGRLCCVDQAENSALAGGGETKGENESASSFPVPRGLALVQHTLAMSRSLGQRDLHLITIAILNATLKPYFKFLSAWLFEGKHLGPGDAEFGVEVTRRQNLAAENALYWTHTFVATPRNPQDLSDQDLFDINRLNRTIVSCGKSVNLLRRCAAGGGPEDCKLLKVAQPKIVLVTSPAQEQRMRNAFEDYRQQVQSLQEHTSLMPPEERNFRTEKQQSQNLEKHEDNEVNEGFGKDSEVLKDIESSKIYDSKPEVKSPPLRRKGKKEVTGKIGHEIPKPLPDDTKDIENAERERIEAVKRDLKLFYGEKVDDEEAEQITPHEERSLMKNQKSEVAAAKEIEPASEIGPGQEKPSPPKAIEGTPVKRYLSKSERNTPMRETAPSPLSKAGHRKKSADDLVRATHPLFKVPSTDPFAPPAPPKKNLLPSVDQFVTIGDAKATPYAPPPVFGVQTRTGKAAASDHDQESGTPHMPASFLPLDLMLKRSISIPLQVQFGLVSRQLLTHFFQSSPVSLWTYLETIRRFLLLQDSEFAHGLCFGLLENEARAGLQKQPQTFLSPSSATNILQEAISGSILATHDPLASDNLSFLMVNSDVLNGASSNNVSTDKIGTRGSSSSQFDEDYLTLSLNVSWPFNIVLTSDVMRGYQRVFKLLLHLEKAYIGLQQAFMLLRKQRDFDTDKCYKEIQFMRHGMLNYVNNLRGYLRSQILDKCWIKFKEDVDHHVVCLDSLRTVHSFYVDKVLSKSFLKKELGPIRETVYKTLGSINKFSQIILGESAESFDPRAIHSRALREAKTFNACLTFFISVVSKLEVRGYKHHHQQLLVALKNSTMPI